MQGIKKIPFFREYFTVRSGGGIDCRCNFFSYPNIRIARIKTVVKAWFSKVFHSPCSFKETATGTAQAFYSKCPGIVPYYSFNFFTNNSDATLGLTFPLVSFITWPIRNCKAFFLPAL